MLTSSPAAPHRRISQNATIFPWELSRLNMTEAIAALDGLLPDEAERSLMNSLSVLFGSWTPHPSCTERRSRQVCGSFPPSL